jgi:SAM-dependent methyltransferase
VDTVVCLNVLEHIEDDAGTLRNIRTTLEPGGRLLLLVPNGPDAYGSIDKAIGHFRRYTQPGLKTLLEENGYEVERILEFNRVSRPGWRFTGQVLKSTTISPAGMRVFDKFVWLWRMIDQKLPWEPISIIAIARRAS